MHEVDLVRFNGVLSQSRIPVAIRLGVGQGLYVKVPYSTDNRAWLRAGKRSNPKWLSEKKQWELPQSWFNDFVDRCLQRYKNVYVIQPLREQEKCSPACRNAVGHECQCSCMGANHGSGSHAGWFDISETFSVRWGAKSVACRLIVARG